MCGRTINRPDLLILPSCSSVLNGFLEGFSVILWEFSVFQVQRSGTTAFRTNENNEAYTSERGCSPTVHRSQFNSVSSAGEFNFPVRPLSAFQPEGIKRLKPRSRLQRTGQSLRFVSVPKQETKCAPLQYRRLLILPRLIPLVFLACEHCLRFTQLAQLSHFCHAAKLSPHHLQGLSPHFQPLTVYHLSNSTLETYYGEDLVHIEVECVYLLIFNSQISPLSG